MMKLNIQFFGGRGSAGGNNSSTKDLTIKDFTKASSNVNMWESKLQIVDAVGMSRTGREVGVALKSTDSKYRIIQDGDKFKVYRTMFGGKRQYIKSVKTLKDAIKLVNKNNKT